MGSSRITAWFDPGKTTGIASWDSRYQAFSSLEAEDDLKATGHWIELLVEVNGMRIISDDHGDRSSFQIEIGWERYVVTPGNARHGTAYWSLETIGMLRYLALKHDLVILPPQTSSMMTAGTDERLKALGWYKPGKPHANDAARHLMRYMMKAGTLPLEMKNRVFRGEPFGHRTGNVVPIR